MVGYPPGTTPYPPWGGMGYVPGVYPTLPAPHPAPYSARRHPVPASKRASGLNRPRGDRVGRGSGAQGAPRFLYLRSIWPGSQIAPRAIWGNRWIGSRAQPARGGLDVSDLECLNLGCASRLIWPDPSTKETDPATDRRIRLLRHRIRLGVG